MTKRTHDNMRAVLDVLSDGRGVTTAARSIGVTARVIYMWLRESAMHAAKVEAREMTAEESPYLINWPLDDEGNASGDPIWFHRGPEQARQMAKVSLETGAFELLQHGYKRLVLENGKPVYEVDDKAIAEWGDDKKSAEELGGHFDYPYKHDANGARIRMYVYDPVPAQLKIHGMRALVPSWDVSEKREIDQKVSGGVMIIGAPAKPLTPLRQDLETRLAEVRANGPTNLPKPVQVFKPDGANGDQPDDVPISKPKLPHPRQYRLPDPPVKPDPGPPRPAYLRGERASTHYDSEGVGHGVVRPGGVRTVG
jgi:hypothetical protein